MMSMRDGSDGPVWPGFLLAGGGGFVDGVGFLVLLDLFVAQMAGNTTLLGGDIAQAEWSLALRRLAPILMFLAGVAVGAALDEAVERRGIRRKRTIILGLESLLLLVALIWGSGSVRNGVLPPDPAWRFYALMALLAMSMGMQNIALRRIHGLTVHTTYITGMLQAFGEGIARFLYWLYDAARGAESRNGALHSSPQRQAFGQILLAGGVYGAYLLGAIGGGFFGHRWDLVALAFPVGALAIVIAAELRQPAQPAARDDAGGG
jgi:uncharacterized membrane protein YoaK (UPF0700 family)